MTVEHHESTLANGARIATLTLDSPVAELRVVAGLPADVDPASSALAALTAGLLTRHGSWTEAAESRAGVDAGTGAFVVAVTCLAEDLPAVIGRLADALRDPRHSGTAASDLHRRVLDPRRLVVVCAGPSDAAPTRRRLVEAVEPLVPLAPETPTSGTRGAQHVQEEADGEVRADAPAPEVGGTHWIGHQLGLGILGDLGSGRLTRTVRERGLAYGVSLYRDEHADAPVTRLATIGAATDTVALAEALRACLADYCSHGPTPDELLTATRRAHGTAVVSAEAVSTMVDAVAGFVCRGLPAAWLQQSAHRLLTASRAEVEAAAHWFSPAAFGLHPPAHDPGPAPERTRH